MKRSKVIENAFDEIDTKFIEEPMERRCAREEKPADQKVLKMRRGCGCGGAGGFPGSGRRVPFTAGPFQSEQRI